MKKAIGSFLAGAVICVALSAFSAALRAQTDEMPATDSPSSAATSEPVPLSSLATSTPAPSKKTIKRKHTSRRKTHAKKSKHHRAAALSGRARIRKAQISLSQLGYNPGSADGVMGSRTKSAIRSFQRDHHLHADGVLGPLTYDALMRESGNRNVSENFETRPPDFYAAHPDFYGYYGADYANPTALGSPQVVPVRFGNMEIDEQQTGQTHQYTIMYNGRNVFHVENQPAPINVSRTFTLSNADAIVITSYNNGNTICPYQHALLVVQANSSGLHQINNCTRPFEAYTQQGTLIISFPEDQPNAWTSGAMWRYENGTLSQF